LGFFSFFWHENSFCIGQNHNFSKLKFVEISAFKKIKFETCLGSPKRALKNGKRDSLKPKKIKIK
jgi:hypothetical protein